jgi:hypothetical protein
LYPSSVTFTLILQLKILGLGILHCGIV